LLLLGMIASPCVALAQDEAPPEDDSEQHPPLASIPPETTITVLANGTREPLDSTGQAVTIFTRNEMKAVQGADITRLLERSIGVSLSRNGGPGNFTAVRVRGAEGEQLLVLIDGVRVADPAAPGGGF